MFRGHRQAGLTAIAALTTLGAVGAIAPSAMAQANRMNAPGTGQSDSRGTRAIGGVEMPEPGSPEWDAYRDMQKRRVDLERDLRKIRATYFRNIRNTEIRQAGIQRLRDFTDAAAFPSLLEIFRDEGEDVRDAVIAHLAGLGTPEADATLAWTSVFDDDKAIRREARKHLLERKQAWGEVPRAVQSVVATGLHRERSNDVVTAAAQLASDLRLYDAIPMMINAQASAGGRSSRGDGALAYILVGRQQSFVSDLDPVIGDNAAGFDPQIAVVTEGVVMVVEDAAVVTYNWGVHHSLVDLSSAGWGGQSTRRLGFDGDKWRKWYEEEFLPYRRGLAKAGSGDNPGGG